MVNTESASKMSCEQLDVVVVGSFMTDVVSYVEKLPRVGETLSGHKLAICCGGKGANQAVSAARLGAKTGIVGKLGDDSFGQSYKEALVKEGILLDHVSTTNKALTGLAQIIVENSGQNSIVIVPGANDHLSTEDITASNEMIKRSKIMLAVLEIPQNTVLTALKLAHEAGVFTILNAAPAVANLRNEFYLFSDIFCVNETEAEMLTGQSVATIEDAKKAAEILMEKGCKKHVVLTLGKNGAVVVSRGGSDQEAFKAVHVTSPSVNAVDTTGAGDCFLGSLAFFLASFPEWDLSKAIERSCKVASISVQKPGTQPSFPKKDELDVSLLE